MVHQRTGRTREHLEAEEMPGVHTAAPQGRAVLVGGVALNSVFTLPADARLLGNHTCSRRNAHLPYWDQAFISRRQRRRHSRNRRRRRLQRCVATGVVLSVRSCRQAAAFS